VRKELWNRCDAVPVPSFISIPLLNRGFLESTIRSNRLEYYYNAATPVFQCDAMLVETSLSLEISLKAGSRTPRTNRNYFAFGETWIYDRLFGPVPVNYRRCARQSEL
jgi:hypothetical protein